MRLYERVWVCMGVYGVYIYVNVYEYISDIN